MTRLVLTDALIREALSPSPHTTAPAGLLAQITADVARTPQRRVFRLPVLPQSRRLTWVLVGAATLLVLLGMLLVAGGSRDPLEAFLPPAPSPLPQQLLVDPTEIEAVSADEAWVADGRGLEAGPWLWHRTKAGWAGPVEIVGAGPVAGLARLPDGRLVVGTSRGTWVGRDDTWSRISEQPVLEVEVDGTGTIWATVTSADGWTVEGLRWYREADGAWDTGTAPCPAGGLDIAIGADGSVWTAGYRDYGGTHGLARSRTTCAEVFPLEDGPFSYDVPAVTADGRGRVAAAVMEPRGTEPTWPAGRIMAWDGASWTEVRGGAIVADLARDGLAYGPDGSLWASINGSLVRHRDARWTDERHIMPGSPLSVAPDGAVWFVSEDAATGAASVDRLLPEGDAALATPAPLASSPLQRPRVGIDGAAEIVAISADEAWASDENDGLWHRTAAGWAGPYIMTPSGSTPDRFIRGLARMPDGRIVVGADNGLWVGNEQGWTKVTSSGSTGVAVDSQGVIWTSHGGRTLRSYVQPGDGWQSEVYPCGAGGWVVAAADDGSIWTAGIAYSGTDGVARLASGTCSEVKPWGDGVTHEVMSLATSAGGRVAASILDVPQGDDYVSARIMTWDGNRWTTLREGEALVGVGWNRLSYAPDGSLWAAFDGRLWRYVDGTESSIRTGVAAGPVAVAPDGAVWFVAEDPKTGGAFVDRLVPGRGTAAPMPTASPQAELSANGPGVGMLPLLGMDEEQAWAAKSGATPGPELWSRTVAGWTGGPIDLVDQATNARIAKTLIRDIAALDDGRLAIATDTGVWVRGTASWARAWRGQAWDVEVAPDGRLWVGGVDYQRATGRLRVLRETSAGWQPEWSGCSAGGMFVALAADGSAWTAGFTYVSLGGLARVQDGHCEELFPLGDGRDDEVVALAASPSGAVAVSVRDPWVGDVPDGGRILEWRDGRWTELHAGPDLLSGGPRTLAYTPDGALWAAFGGALNRYADDTWQEVAKGGGGAQVSAAHDGSVWYERADGIVDRVTWTP